MTPSESLLIQRLKTVEHLLVEYGSDLDLLLLDYRARCKPWHVRVFQALKTKLTVK